MMLFHNFIEYIETYLSSKLYFVEEVLPGLLSHDAMFQEERNMENNFFTDHIGLQRLNIPCIISL